MIDEDKLEELQAAGDRLMGEQEMSFECERCFSSYVLRDGCEPTRYCDLCAQEIIVELESIIKKIDRIVQRPYEGGDFGKIRELCRRRGMGK